MVIYEIPILGELAPAPLILDRLLHSGRSFFVAGVWPTTQAGVIHGYMEEMAVITPSRSMATSNKKASVTAPAYF